MTLQARNEKGVRLVALSPTAFTTPAFMLLIRKWKIMMPLKFPYIANSLSFRSYTLILPPPQGLLSPPVSWKQSPPLLSVIATISKVVWDKFFLGGPGARISGKFYIFLDQKFLMTFFFLLSRFLGRGKLSHLIPPSDNFIPPSENFIPLTQHFFPPLAQIGSSLLPSPPT